MGPGRPDGGEQYSSVRERRIKTLSPTCTRIEHHLTPGRRDRGGRRERSRTRPGWDATIRPGDVPWPAAGAAGTGTSGVAGIPDSRPERGSCQNGAVHAHAACLAEHQDSGALPQDDRVATVLKGTWYFGYGERFDEAALTALEAGSFYTEPPNVTQLRDDEGRSHPSSRRHGSILDHAASTRPTTLRGGEGKTSRGVTWLVRFMVMPRNGLV